MNRRGFLGALAAAAGGIVLGEPEPRRRVYSFLWDNPLVERAPSDALIALAKRMRSGRGFGGPDVIWINQRTYDVLRHLLPPSEDLRVDSVVPLGSLFLAGSPKTE